MNAPEKIVTTSLHTAMTEAWPKIEGATKGKRNPHFKSSYADLQSVIDVIKPYLAEHGLWFSQKTHDAEGGVKVETVLHHASGESYSFGALYVPAAKRDPQGYGSALTYARRYSLMTAFGVPAVDDDGNAATEAVRNAPKPQPKTDWQPVTDALKNAAMNGKTALQDEFNNHKDKPGFAEFWEKAKPALLAAAKSADEAKQ